MKGMAVLAVAVAAALQLPPAQAQTNRIYANGNWQVFSGTDSNQRAMCLVQSAGADGRQVNFEQVAGGNGLVVTLSKPTWKIPDNTAIPVSIQYDSGPQNPMQGTGSGDTVTLTVPYDQVAQFDRQIREGRALRVNFPSGNESPWNGSLDGSNAVFTAFDNCRIRLNTTPTQASAVTAAPTQSAMPTTPTQPFSAAALPASTQPAAQMPAPAVGAAAPESQTGVKPPATTP